MVGRSIGFQIHRATPVQTLATVVRADELGVPTAWLVTGGARPDALTLIAAAAVRTKSIRLGTAIVPTFPRHPLVMVQQAEVVANLAPGRFVLGVGPSHERVIKQSFGVAFERPLEHLREYVTVLRAALHTGSVNFEGSRFQVHAQAPNPASVPIMISALRRKSFQLAGEIADGAISWVCPAQYLHDVALPALRDGAARANRAVPGLVGHVFIAVSEDADAVMQVARQELAPYVNLPVYAKMLAASGYPEAEWGEWSTRMYDAVLIHGGELDVVAGLRSFANTAGANELVASIIPVGDDEASIERALRMIAGL